MSGPGRGPDSPAPGETGAPNSAPAKRIDPGDDVLVDASMYGPWPDLWCRVTRLAPGSAAVYPIKVLLPHGGEGQYKATEIRDHRDRTPGEPN